MTTPNNAAALTYMGRQLTAQEAVTMFANQDATIRSLRDELATLRATVAELIGDVAAARRERDEAREAQEYAELELAYLANEMIFNGNSIGWIASKADKYKAALGRAWDAFTATGGKCDGNTELADAIRQRGAALTAALAPKPEGGHG